MMFVACPVVEASAIFLTGSSGAGIELGDRDEQERDARPTARSRKAARTRTVAVERLRDRDEPERRKHGRDDDALVERVDDRVLALADPGEEGADDRARGSRSRRARAGRARGSPDGKAVPRSITATAVTAYVSNRSAAIPAQSPTLSPTLSAITAGLRGSSSGIPASIFPTRSAPTSAAFVKMPPPRRAKTEISEPPNARPIRSSTADSGAFPSAPVRNQ